MREKYRARLPPGEKAKVWARLRRCSPSCSSCSLGCSNPPSLLRKASAVLQVLGNTGFLKEELLFSYIV